MIKAKELLIVVAILLGILTISAVVAGLFYGTIAYIIGSMVGVI
ncbi:hypothetical protein VspSw1_122 [Vibrio phage VspSw_1]|uniref:Uncharacterized protein n=1 Tax=Vibrio phage VspSw_1 TaxID=2484249 RepID=A0A411BKM5_9CAUD|nr:hypothetical protein HOV08_gp122 [Vibrio phage VspSw_1]QAY02190.1 hypothetical protein VspSw1_122 [Vibrio phage VspSw_1]